MSHEDRGGAALEYMGTAAIKEHGGVWFQIGLDGLLQEHREILTACHFRASLPLICMLFDALRTRSVSSVLSVQFCEL